MRRLLLIWLLHGSSRGRLAALDEITVKGAEQ
jgi:hypothetical protein